MNAVAETRAHPAHPTHKFRLLLRREFWEHKGGFLWAPLVAGGIFLLLSRMGMGVGEMAARRAAGEGKLALENGEGIVINGLDFAALARHLDAKDLHQLGGALDVSLLMAASWPFIVLAFVVFFYCLGALYDERRDRSVLFWKSLPLSDAQTVWSKVASAVLVAPVLAVGAALATGLGFLLLISVFVLFHGGNPVQLLWGPASPFALAGRLLAVIPVYALWALPTVGWLLLCSAWARSKPFLWAVMIPVFAGIFVSWFDLMQLFDLGSSWFWKNIVARALTSVAPGTWLSAMDMSQFNDNDPGSLLRVLDLQRSWSILATPQLWIGAIAGVAMILAAVRLRRWRDEG
jgi:ABC-2 type transport system permease protein